MQRSYKKQNYYPEEFENYISSLTLTDELKAFAYTIWCAAIETAIKSSSEYQKEWRKNNKEKVKLYQSTCQQKWKEKNKDSISEYNKTYFQDWYQKNKEKRLAYNREYVSKNKTKVLEYKREYRIKKQEELKKQESD